MSTRNPDGVGLMAAGRSWRSGPDEEPPAIPQRILVVVLAGGAQKPTLSAIWLHYGRRIELASTAASWDADATASLMCGQITAGIRLLRDQYPVRVDLLVDTTIVSAYVVRTLRELLAPAVHRAGGSYRTKGLERMAVSPNVGSSRLTRADLCDGLRDALSRGRLGMGMDPDLGRGLGSLTYAPPGPEGVDGYREKSIDDRALLVGWATHMAWPTGWRS
ncbi:hypothetical protein [Streptomyces hydrogenans]|uniref:hypothetical protein n=1 Tax=Streptomyces hydrogenans TaxID=1873719 RepID=UPI0037F7507D